MLHSITKRTGLLWLSAILLVGAAMLSLSLKAAVAGGQEPIAIDVPAPELVGGPWLNTPKGAPIKIASRRGKVTILHFWTFG